ncbi:MAG TPA: 6,7-dimethyl-8-ribityllumazine synthase [Pirellulales bacterium]|nr:6,7-dimethyl-8-ribityllumazine synthase [Pirellulales bacterium]
MPTIPSDRHDAADGRFAVVVSRYHEAITSKLLAGALATLQGAGVKEEAIDVAWTPGAFEIPLVADQMAGSGNYAAVLCLGAVIRGATTHDQHINRAVSLGIMEANLRHGIPVLFGVLTCDTVEQAIQRAGGHVSNKEPTQAAQEGKPAAGSQDAKPVVGNKGVECATAALEMVSLLRKLKEQDTP